MLKIDHLSISLKPKTEDCQKRFLLKNLSLQIDSGEIYGLLGESGSGKSTCAKSILNLLSNSLEKTGNITLTTKNNTSWDLNHLNSSQKRELYGKNIGYVAQDPSMSLNPLMTIGRQLKESLFFYKNKSRKEMDNAVDEILLLMDFTNPKEIKKKYPHEFSGGQQQRLVMAMAMIREPSLIILDEPTTALDSIVKKKILDLLKRWVKK